MTNTKQTNSSQKYLSYEKSKRLAELGYKPETHTGWWAPKSKIWLPRPMYLLGKNYTPDIPMPTEDGPYEYVNSLFYCVEETAYKSFDCHDLLTKLQELCVKYSCTLNVFIKAKKLCCTLYIPNIDRGVVFYEDEPLVELFGAALIALLDSKVLEEKGADAPGGANAG